MTVLDVKRAGEAEEHIAIGLAGKVESNVHRFTSKAANVALKMRRRHDILRKIGWRPIMRWFPGVAAALACAVVIQAYPSAAAVQQQPGCRQFTSTVKIDGRNQRVSGRACQQPDGSWQIMPADTAGAGAAPPQGYGYPAPYDAGYPYPYPYPYYPYSYPYYWNGWGGPFSASFFFGNRFGGFQHFGHDGFHHGGGMGGHHH
jgi:hypothetical protein